MPSTESCSGPVEGQIGWSHRYGLPLWMRCNFDRLNVSTDFEEYACSPPETDSGFIPDFDAKFSTNLFREQQQLPNNTSGLKSSKSSPAIGELEHSAQQLCKAIREAAGQGFLTHSSVPHILGCHSSSTSTDTTPSTTPQGSPFNSRKHFRKEDILSTSSSRKWFYQAERSEAMPVLPENAASTPEVTTVKKPHPRKKPLASKGCRKYMVSNFDLNAVSPTSW